MKKYIQQDFFVTIILKNCNWINEVISINSQKYDGFTPESLPGDIATYLIKELRSWHETNNIVLVNYWAKDYFTYKIDKDGQIIIQ